MTDRRLIGCGVGTPFGPKLKCFGGQPITLPEVSLSHVKVGLLFVCNSFSSQRINLHSVRDLPLCSESSSL